MRFHLGVVFNVICDITPMSFLGYQSCHSDVSGAIYFVFLEAQFFMLRRKSLERHLTCSMKAQFFPLSVVLSFLAFYILTNCLDPGANSQLLVPFRVGADVLSIELS